MADQGQDDPVQTMMQMVGGFWVSRCLFAAATLGLADRVSGPTPVETLAEATGSHPRALYRLMRALASVGVFRELPDQRFEPTPLSDVLRTDAPISLRYTVMSELGVSHYGPWGEILYGIQTNKPSFDHVFGMPCFDWFGKNPDRAKVFNQSMTELTKMVEPAVLEAYDFSDAGTLIDVGGGYGSLLAAVLKRHPGLRGIVYDAPSVVAGAGATFERAGVADRAEAVGGDFFQSVPAGGDTYLMKHIIHDWDDDRCTTILRHCHDVMKPGHRVLIVDQVLPGPNEASIGKFSDLLMMLMPGGIERTEAEFRALLTAGGFELERIVPTKSPVSVVVGIKR